jgi:hypothetical protein
MVMVNLDTNRQSGNVLFLILIAVALFAALSYAVTQSTRSGGGSTDREQALLGSAALTQYPTSLRTSVIRMILGGLDVRNLAFNGPAAFGSVSTTRLVFHPDGGGAVFQAAPADVMASGAAGTWSHNAQMAVPQVGRDGSGGNDLIAYLAGVGQSTCQRINEELGFAVSGECGTYQADYVPTVVVTADTDITTNMINTYTFPSSPTQSITCTGGTASAFNGKASGCFYDTTLNSGNFIFYSVIIER